MTTKIGFETATETTGLSVLDDAINAVKENKEKPVPKEGRRVPGGGKCVRCGEKCQVNRLKLCYRCWVIIEIIQVEKGKFNRDWNEKMPHPDWCQCTLPEHKRASTGN